MMNSTNKKWKIGTLNINGFKAKINPNKDQNVEKKLLSYVEKHDVCILTELHLSPSELHFLQHRFPDAHYHIFASLLPLKAMAYVFL